jgi:hypothetical protein
MGDVNEGISTRAAKGPFVHYCQHPDCGEWGAFGYPDNKWTCYEHRPENLEALLIISQFFQQLAVEKAS